MKYSSESFNIDTICWFNTEEMCSGFLIFRMMYWDSLFNLVAAGGILVSTLYLYWFNVDAEFGTYFIA